MFKFDITSIQELKLNEAEAKLLLRFDGYFAYIKTRNLNPDHGSGVAILTKSGIPHSRIYALNDSLEIVGLRVDLNEVHFDFFSFYRPSNQVIPYEYLKNLEFTKSEFILVEDLNLTQKPSP